MPDIFLYFPGWTLVLCNRRTSALYKVSIISDDLPPPETPVIHVKVPNRNSTVIFFRLFSWAQENNLKNITVEFRLGTFTCITGVSGGGKSSLIIETLYKALVRRLHNTRVHPGKYKKISGTEFLDKVVDINQSPIGQLAID